MDNLANPMTTRVERPVQSPCITIPSAITNLRNAVAELDRLSLTLLEGNAPIERAADEPQLSYEPPMATLLRQTPDELNDIAEQVAQLTATIRGTLFDA